MAEFQIPLFDLNYGEEEIAAVTETLRNRWISMGPKCKELEDLSCEMFHTKHAYALASCTAALHLACYVLGIGEGDEVICPSLTFAATVNCIRYVGATPVFCDIKGKDDLGIDPEEIEGLITDRTKAVIVMHYGGFPCEMDRIMEIARAHKLFVIEDACHGPLSEYHGKKLGTFGDVGCFSFFSNKNISTGEGGMLITDREDLAEKVRLARSHGMTTMSFERASGHATSYEIETLGFNYRMDDIRASLGCVQMKKLLPDLKKRQAVRERYEKNLSDCDRLIVPYLGHQELCSNYIFPVVLNDADVGKRDRIRTLLQEQGIQTSVHYPAAHRFALYRKYPAFLPHTEYVTDCEITLPMYGRLTMDEVDEICEAFKKSLESV